MSRTTTNSNGSRHVKDHSIDHQECETLNILLLSELAAVEAYERILSHIEDQQVLADLEKIRDEHARAATALRSLVLDRSEEPRKCTGPWSTVSVAVNGTAGIISPTTALWALCQGEQHAINEYEAALSHEGLTAPSKHMIRIELLPRNRRHLEELNRLMGGMK
jgi:hypothetical protein